MSQSSESSSTSDVSQVSEPSLPSEVVSTSEPSLPSEVVSTSEPSLPSEVSHVSEDTELTVFSLPSAHELRIMTLDALNADQNTFNVNTRKYAVLVAGHIITMAKAGTFGFTMGPAWDDDGVKVGRFFQIANENDCHEYELMGNTPAEYKVGANSNEEIVWDMNTEYFIQLLRHYDWTAEKLTDGSINVSWAK